MAVYVNTEVSSLSDKSAAKSKGHSEHIFDHPSSDAPRHQDR